MANSRTLFLSLESSRKQLYLTIHEDSISVANSDSKASSRIPFQNIISATIDADLSRVELTYILKLKKHSLHKLQGTLLASSQPHASEWVEEVCRKAYDGVKQSRRLLVFVNPHSGPGKARGIYDTKIAPVLEAAGCSIEVIYTTQRNHAFDIVQKTQLNYDAIVVLSGDGLIHEVLNGLAQHSEPIRALAIPVAPVPTGSGNGMCLNLFGVKEGFDVVLAAMNIVKGRPMNLDLFSFVQKDRRVFSFMSQCIGLMADLDLGTEHLRWMGDTRFVYGFVRGALGRPCSFELSYKLAEDDKAKMVETLRKRPRAPAYHTVDPVSPTNTTELPSLQHVDSTGNILDPEGWITSDKPALFLYAGQGPWVSRDYMPFAASLPDDGFIDLVVQEQSVSGMLINGGMSDGKPFWHPKNRYLKVQAYQVRPHAKEGNLSVDGERFPLEKFAVEVHQGMGNILSLYGRFACDFGLTQDPIEGS